jgi:hypothetical protein
MGGGDLVLVPTLLNLEYGPPPKVRHHYPVLSMRVATKEHAHVSSGLQDQTCNAPVSISGKDEKDGRKRE